MLHCLYNIYRYAHPDFYGEDPSGPEWIKNHTDHCVDNLRQVCSIPTHITPLEASCLIRTGQFVQCHVGTGFETYKWLDTRKAPWPVISTDEVCVNWAHFDSWVRERSIPAKDMGTFKNGNLVSHPIYGPVYEEDLYNKTLPSEHGRH